MDYPKTINENSDFVGGIDHDPLHFDQNEQYAAAFVFESQLPNTTISARAGSLTTTPIATPLGTGGGGGNILPSLSHLPESPPDSSSEPPFSPVQDVSGLTLTTRDNYNGAAGGTGGGVVGGPLPQFTSPYQHSFTNNFQNPMSAVEANGVGGAGVAMAAVAECGIGGGGGGGGGIRVKHETGLLMNPASLAPVQLPLGQIQPNDAYIEIQPPANCRPAYHILQHHSQATNASCNGGNNLMVHYVDAGGSVVSGDGRGGGVPGQLYHSAAAYQTFGGTETSGSAYAMEAVGDAGRVMQKSHQVVAVAIHAPGHRASTPLTPHARKRKMSTQLDGADFARIKPDPGLAVSPLGTPYHHHHALSRAHPLEGEAPQLGPTSPRSGVALAGGYGVEVDSTPVHSLRSLSPTLSMVNSNADNNSLDGSGAASANSGGEAGDGGPPTRTIRFSPFQQNNWHTLLDRQHNDIEVVFFRVDADKGFNFSLSDEAFVCQKKNHFQITCQTRINGDAEFVRTQAGAKEKIISFRLHFYGVKVEAPNQTIRVEESQSDRSKKPFNPVPLNLRSYVMDKKTVGRLHFSETTNNNMRKKGRPNPEQRYFQLVVGLHVHTINGNFAVVSQGSEQIIVRASNPGQFESDVDLCWQRGGPPNTIFYAGNVGINTEEPKESLVVNGHLRVSGRIVHPSDSRAKQEIGELDTSQQLRNLQKIRIVRYRYEPEFAVHAGLRRASESDPEDVVDTGVIAQEVREVLPEAVLEAGSIVLRNGTVIENFLLVNKDRILMENIGAVKELSKRADSLGTRVENLERLNNRHKEIEMHYEHAHGRSRVGSSASSRQGYQMCSNRTLQMLIVPLVLVMAACLAAVTLLYFLEHGKLGELLHAQLNAANEKGGIDALPKDGVGGGGDYFGGAGGMSNIDGPHGIMRKPIEGWDSNRASSPTTTRPMPTTTTTTLAPRLNKPSGNKKLKAAPQQRQPDQKAPQSVEPRRVEPFHNSSEKAAVAVAVADGIPLGQDFENNSIDVDALHVTSKAPAARQLNAAARGDPNSTAQHAAGSTIDIVIVSTSSSNVVAGFGTGDMQPDAPVGPTAGGGHVGGGGDAGVYVVSYEKPSTSNKSHGVLETAIEGGDALDLQNLSSNNDSTDITRKSLLELEEGEGRESQLGRRSTSPHSVDWRETRTLAVSAFGAPMHCTEKASSKEASKCESVCFEDSSNQLALIGQRSAAGPAPQQPLGERGDDEVDADGDTDEFVAARDDVDDADFNESHFEALQVQQPQQQLVANSTQPVAPGKTSHPTQAIAKEIPNEQQSKENDHLDASEGERDDDDHYENESSLLHGGESNGAKAEALIAPAAAVTDSLSIEANRPPLEDCWKISSCIVAVDSQQNSTLRVEEYCPNVRKSLTLNYHVALSKFFKEPNIELRFSSATLLSWTVCSHQEENIKGTAVKHVVDAPTSANSASQGVGLQLPRHQHVSILKLSLPPRGPFVKKIELRGTDRTDQENICTKTSHETRAPLQYNFSIVRVCD